MSEKDNGRGALNGDEILSALRAACASRLKARTLIARILGGAASGSCMWSGPVQLGAVDALLELGFEASSVERLLQLLNGVATKAVDRAQSETDSKGWYLLAGRALAAAIRLAPRDGLLFLLDALKSWPSVPLILPVLEFCDFLARATQDQRLVIRQGAEDAEVRFKDDLSQDADILRSQLLQLRAHCINLSDAEARTALLQSILSAYDTRRSSMIAGAIEATRILLTRASGEDGRNWINEFNQTDSGRRLLHAAERLLHRGT